MDTSPESVLAEKSSLSPSLSGTIHSRVAASNSQHRLRAALRIGPTTKDTIDDTDDDVQVTQTKMVYSNVISGLGITASNSSTALLPAPIISGSNREQYWSFSWYHIFRWILMGYCCFSVLFFTFKLIQNSEQFIERFKEKISDVPISAMNSLSGDYRLSKLTSVKPLPLSFEPNVLQSLDIPHSSEVTACLWLEDSDLKSLTAWSSSWKGPISLVLVTNSEPLSASRQLLLNELNKLRKNSSLASRLSVHVFQKLPKTHTAPNAYLNLARLFSLTPYTVLFPMRPLLTLPKQLHEDVQHLVNVSKRENFAPVVLSSLLNSTSPKFLFPPLVPLLIDQEYPVWCTERFFSVSSRSSDWEECLWQMWINSLGSMQFVPKSKWSSTAWDVGDTEPPPHRDKGFVSIKDRIHRRLSARFRHETCILASKNLKSLTGLDSLGANSSVSTSNKLTFRWLKQACKQATIRN